MNIEKGDKVNIIEYTFFELSNSLSPNSEYVVIDLESSVANNGKYSFHTRKIKILNDKGYYVLGNIEYFRLSPSCVRNKMIDFILE